MSAVDVITPADPSGIGIVQTSANQLDRMTVKLRFADPEGMPTTDDQGGMGEMSAPAGCTAPGSGDGAIDLAAIFTAVGLTALEGVDATIAATALSRDLTVQAILAWDIDAQHTAGVTGTIIARGHGDAAIERMPFGLELVIANYATRTGSIRWRWQTIAGVAKVQTAANFQWAPVGATSFALFTATRRWESPTSVVIRYYLNDQLLAEITSVDGDIASSVDGSTTIGARKSAGVYGSFLCGALDELAIFAFEMCAEEIAATWARIYDHQRDGLRIIHELMPPGMPISDDPASRVQMDLRTLGIGLGFASGMVENMRENLMPDQAYGDVLRRWERITREPARPGDSLDRRRARVVGHIGSRGGVSVPGVQVALAEVLDDQPLGADLQVFAFDNTIRDDFATLETERWRVDPSADWSVLANELRVQAIAGTFPWSDVYPSGSAKSALIGVEAPRTRGIPPIARVSLACSMNPIALPANAEAGVVLWNWALNSLFFFGLRNVAGAYKVGYQRYRDGAAVDGAWQVLATTALQRHWLRLRWHSGVFAGTVLEEGYDLSYSTVGDAEADYTTAAPLKWIRDVGWAGLYFRTNGATGGAADARFADFALRNELGTRPFYFYVVRDPGLGGSPDFVGADRILQRMKHGFTSACAIASRHFFTDDPGSVTDCNPTGCL